LRRHKLGDDKIGEILAMPPILCHARGRVRGSDLPSLILSPPIERDRRSLAEAHKRPLSPPVITSMVYKPQLGHAEPEFTTTEHDSSGLEHSAPTVPPRFSEDLSLLRRYREIHGGFRFVHAFYIRHIG